MLLPALARAKEKAWRTDCLNNLRQLGIGAHMYATDGRDELPTLHRSGSYFTTYWMRRSGAWTNSAGRSYNLGLLNEHQYIKTPLSFYCMGARVRPNEALAYSGPNNPWGGSEVRSAYPARFTQELATIATAKWKLRDYSAKVIYSDFVGVKNYQGGGIDVGFIYPVHNGRGFNRLFGDGSTRWARPGRYTGLLSSSDPSLVRQLQHYEELDTLP